MLITAWILEIRLVGLLDWLWFVVYLKRDEFSHKLSLNKYYPDLDGLVLDRTRAHNLDLLLGGSSV